MRVSEATGVRPDDVERRGGELLGILSVREGKGKKFRSVPIHPQLMEALDSAPKPTYNNPYIGRDRSSVTRAYAKAGIRGTHTLRHSAARHWLNSQNIEANTVQLWLGHSHLTTTLNQYLELYAAAPGLMGNVD
jgi:integrase